MPNCDCGEVIKNQDEQQVLIILLLINAVMFVFELTAGIYSESAALIADSLDMLADATVYGIGLYAVGKPLTAKIRAAHLSGLFQLVLGIFVLLDVTRRFVWGSEPESILMLAVGLVALAANIICLRLIVRHRDGEIHMRASWVFSKNDVIASLGILLAGVLVLSTGSHLPDLLIGMAIAGIVIHGGIHILRDAARETTAAFASIESE